MKFLSSIFLGLVAFLATSQENTFNLMPVPSEYFIGDGKFRLRKDFKISVSGPSESRVYGAANRALRRLAGRTGLFFIQDRITHTDEDLNSVMQIEIDRTGNLELFENESYRLSVSPIKINLSAETDIGALRGIETFLQLLDSDESGYYFPEITIFDRPRFPWRGLLIDVARHFMPIEVIKRNIDGLQAVKMNVLHLHLTEDQGFRIESKVFPKLHQLGSDGKYFTQEQIKEIIQYADERGIRVVPEFDMPGHATSWFVGYPELASLPGPYSIETRFGIMDPTMDPTKESTYQFLEKFITEMAALFPDRYFHIGGDENNGKQWDENPDIQNFMLDKNIQNNYELQSHFNRRIHAILTKNNKHMVGWDEILQPDIPKTIVIQSWRGKEAMYEAAQKGYYSILSNGYYIDLGKPASVHYANEPLPNDNPLTEDEEKFVLGGEAAMWSELVTPETIDSRIWPRTAAIAERLWSPDFIYEEDDMYRRLEVTSLRLEELGLQHNRNYEMMLRRLSNGYNIEPLKTLVDIIEPLKIYARHNQGVKLTSYAPFTRLADAAKPEAMIARNFRKFVDLYIKEKDPETLYQIQKWLVKWKDNHDSFKKLANKSPILRKAVSLSKDMQSSALIGLQAISDMKLHSRKWKQESKIVLNAAKKPRMECELMIVSAIEKLVDNAN